MTVSTRVAFGGGIFSPELESQFSRVFLNESSNESSGLDTLPGEEFVCLIALACAEIRLKYEKDGKFESINDDATRDTLVMEGLRCGIEGIVEKLRKDTSQTFQGASLRVFLDNVVAGICSLAMFLVWSKDSYLKVSELGDSLRQTYLETAIGEDLRVWSHPQDASDLSKGANWKVISSRNSPSLFSVAKGLEYDPLSGKLLPQSPTSTLNSFPSATLAALRQLPASPKNWGADALVVSQLRTALTNSALLMLNSIADIDVAHWVICKGMRQLRAVEVIYDQTWLRLEQRNFDVTFTIYEKKTSLNNLIVIGVSNMNASLEIVLITLKLNIYNLCSLLLRLKK